MLVSKKNASARKAVLSGAFACMLALSAFGCAGQQQAEPQADPEPEVTYRTFGIENEDALNMGFTNETGKDIVELATKPVGLQDADFGKDLIASDDPWAPGETITLFCDTYDVIEAAKGEDASAVADIELLPTYDVQMTFADASTAVLHEVTFDEAEQVQVRIDEASGVAYMTYDVDGKEESTLQTELALKAAADAEAEAALQAQKDAEAAAAAAAEAENQAAQQSKSSTSKNYSYSSGNSGSSGSGGGSASGSGSGGSGAGQSEGSCISPDDLVLNE